jgi:hypothetical protein
MPNHQDDAAHGADGPAREPVKRYMAAPTLEGIIALTEAITGKKVTPERVERLRQKMIDNPFPAPKAAPEG